MTVDAEAVRLAVESVADRIVASYARPMPFKDTPGLRRIAATAIEQRAVVRVRVLPGSTVVLIEGKELREGQELTLSRRRALNLSADGIVALLDESG